MKAVKSFFASWWMPTVASIACLLVFTLAALQPGLAWAYLANTMLAGFGVSLLCVLSAAIVNLWQKRWAVGISNLGAVPLLVVACLFSFACIVVNSMFGPSEDGFADHLTIPDNIEVSAPESEN